MFSKERGFKEEDFRTIRSMGDTKGGQVLSEFLEQETNRYVSAMLRCSASDVESVAIGQQGVVFGRKVWSLLNDEIEKILNENNIEPEEEDAEIQSGRESA